MIQFKNKDFIVFESQLFKTTSTVIGTADCVIVVDPSWLPLEVEEIRNYVNQIKNNRPVYLLFTHSDWDHILGYGAFPEAKVIASEAFQNKKDKEQILNQIRDFDDNYYVDRDYPIHYPQVDILVQQDGQAVSVGNTSLTFYKAEGHTNDGIFTIIDPLGIWMAGDYLSDVEFPFIYDSSTKYEETLEKTNWIFSNHQIRFLVPGHGSLTERLDDIKKRKQESLQYIQDLRKAILNNSDSLHLISNYSYLSSMKKFHEENITLIQKELENA